MGHKSTKPIESREDNRIITETKRNSIETKSAQEKLSKPYLGHTFVQSSVIKRKKATIIKVNTIDEAKKEVLKLVKQGASFREISKIEFQIGDRKKHFNIGEISKIKNGTTAKETDSANINNDTSVLFREFKKGKRPVDLVIETRLNPDFVEQAYQKFAKLNDMRIIPEKLWNNIRSWIEIFKEDECGNMFADFKADECGNMFADFKKYIDEKLTWYVEIYPFFPCSKCRKDIRLDMNSWNDASEYLSQKWIHANCG